MTDMVLTLGDFTFTDDFEQPDRIPVGGGQQRINVHELVGNSRALDAMGVTPAGIDWAGRFRGPDAADKVRALDAVFQAGAPVSLTFGDWAFTVLITSYLPVMENAREFPYTIACDVITTDSADDTSPGIDQMVASDNFSIQSLGGGLSASLQDVTNGLALVNRAVRAPAQALGQVLGELDSAMAAVPNFARADMATLRSVLNPVMAAQQRVGQLISLAEATVGL